MLVDKGHSKRDHIQPVHAPGTPLHAVTVACWGVFVSMWPGLTGKVVYFAGQNYSKITHWKISSALVSPLFLQASTGCCMQKWNSTAHLDDLSPERSFSSYLIKLKDQSIILGEGNYRSYMRKETKPLILWKSIPIVFQHIKIDSGAYLFWC